MSDRRRQRPLEALPDRRVPRRLRDAARHALAHGRGARSASSTSTTRSRSSGRSRTCRSRSRRARSSASSARTAPASRRSSRSSRASRRRPRGRATIRGRVGSILEVGTGFHPELTGRENTYLNGAILGMKRREINAKFDDIVEFSGIGKFIDTPVKRYSSGMYVRLAFAVAAHLDPEVLIIDEVLAVGDYEFQQRCMGRIEEISGSGRTVHLRLARHAGVTRLCVARYWLEGGQVMAEGPSEDVVSQYLQDASGAGRGARLRRSTRRPGRTPSACSSARVVDTSGETSYGVDVREPIGIELQLRRARRDRARSSRRSSSATSGARSSSTRSTPTPAGASRPSSAPTPARRGSRRTCSTRASSASTSPSRRSAARQARRTTSTCRRSSRFHVRDPGLGDSAKGLFTGSAPRRRPAAARLDDGVRRVARLRDGVADDGVGLAVRERRVVVAVRERLQRRGRAVRRRREHPRPGRREAAAVEAARVAEDQRPLRACERRDLVGAGRSSRRPRRRRGRSPSAPTDGPSGGGRRAGCPARTRTAPAPGRRPRGRRTPSGGACRRSRRASSATRRARRVAGCCAVYQRSTYESFAQSRRYAFATSSSRREATAENHASSAVSVTPSKLCARTTNSLPARTLPIPPSAIVRSVSATKAAPCASIACQRSSSKSSVNGSVT